MHEQNGTLSNQTSRSNASAVLAKFCKIDISTGIINNDINFMVVIGGIWPYVMLTLIYCFDHFEMSGVNRLGR